MNLSIIGTGYVGLVSGTSWAEMGHTVVCVDHDARKIERLQDGQCPIFEPGLDRMLTRNLDEGRLSFTTHMAAAVRHAEVIFLALPTPAQADGTPDLEAVAQVVQHIGEVLLRNRGEGYKIIVVKSTVPVGTTALLRNQLKGMGLTTSLDFDVVANPEFLRAGSAIRDFMCPERIIVGKAGPQATKAMTRLYAPFTRQDCPILVMRERSAELTKYAANAFLALKVSYMNEVANLCERLGADVDDVRMGLGRDSRIGRHNLYAGIGIGGSCFPKDVQAMLTMADAQGCAFDTLQPVLTVNARQRHRMVERMLTYFGGSLAQRRVAVWGLAFKPNTDDVREAPAHSIIRDLLALGAEVQAYDPEANESTQAVLGDAITYADDRYGALEGADVLVVCTEWPQFRRLDFMRMLQSLNQPVIFDGRNLYDPQYMAKLGFTYFSMGRPHYKPAVPMYVMTHKGLA